MPISIHAPRGGSDCQHSDDKDNGRVISIHAPRGGSDIGGAVGHNEEFAFQSTLPAGGATN